MQWHELVTAVELGNSFKRRRTHVTVHQRYVEREREGVHFDEGKEVLEQQQSMVPLLMGEALAGMKVPFASLQLVPEATHTLLELYITNMLCYIATIGIPLYF
jgi:hypothetical protein